MSKAITQSYIFIAILGLNVLPIDHLAAGWEENYWSLLKKHFH